MFHFSDWMNPTIISGPPGSLLWCGLNPRAETGEGGFITQRIKHQNISDRVINVAPIEPLNHTRSEKKVHLQQLKATELVLINGRKLAKTGAKQCGQEKLLSTFCPTGTGGKSTYTSIRIPNKAFEEQSMDTKKNNNLKQTKEANMRIVFCCLQTSWTNELDERLKCFSVTIVNLKWCLLLNLSPFKNCFDFFT